MIAEFIMVLGLTVIPVLIMVSCMQDKQIEEMYRQIVGMVGVELPEPEPVLEWCLVCDRVYESRWMEWHHGVYSCSGCADGPRPPGHPLLVFDTPAIETTREFASEAANLYLTPDLMIGNRKAARYDAVVQTNRLLMLSAKGVPW